MKKARAFFERVLVGYGDDSVAQLGGAHVACENISNVAAKLLEDARIGIAPLEKSTRYVRFDQKDAAGNYLFYREPKIMASRHRDAYLEVMNLLFETYSKQMEPMLDHVAKSLPIEQLEVRDPVSGKGLSYAEAAKDERLKRWAETAYRATVRAQACDVLRSYLPAATLTNVGMFGAGQAFEYLVSKLYSHDLSEAQAIGAAIHGELNQLIPSFVKRAQRNDYLVATTAAAKALAARATTLIPVATNEPVTLVDYDRGCGRESHRGDALRPRTPAAGAIASSSRGVEPSGAPANFPRIFSPSGATAAISSAAPSRTSITPSTSSAILGLYRDLHRHRILTQERQDFTTVHGYDTPPEIEEGGFKSEFDHCMERAAELYEQIYRRSAERSAVRRAVRLQDPLVHEAEPARSPAHVRAPHHAPGPSRLPFHLPGDVAQDSIRPSGAGRVGKVYGLAEVSVGKIAVGDADGV